MPSPRNGNVLAESRLVSEYLADRWRGFRTLQRVRVGTLPAELRFQDLTAAELRMVGVWRRWVDAIVVAPPVLWVIEAGIIASPGDLSQLEMYLRLVPETPELQEFASLAPTGRLVYALPDPVLTVMARERGIACEEYAPMWVADYLQTRRERQRRAPLA